MPRHDKPTITADRGRRRLVRLSFAFGVAVLAGAVLAEVSAAPLNLNVAPRPNITVTPRVTPNITVTPRITPNVTVTPRVTPNMTVTPRVTPNLELTPRTVTPRVNVNTGPGRVNVYTSPTNPRLNPSVSGKPVGPRVNPRFVAPVDDDDPAPPRRAGKKTSTKVSKKSPDAGSPPPGGQKKKASSRNIAALLPAGERRFIRNEILTEIAGDPSAAVLDALARRHRLTLLESQRLSLLGTTWYRWQIGGGRSVRQVMSALAGESLVRSRQPNFIYQGSQQGEAGPATGTPAGPVQYTIGKLRLPQAHGLAKGEGVVIAVIDSGIDEAHPELAGVIAGAFDALDKPENPHTHGTAIAGAIAAQTRLVGVAPRSRILAVRAFGASSDGAESTTFKILKGLSWSVEQGARVINMSFAGPPPDMVMRSALAAAHGKGIVLIAAAGNAGPKSGPLFPAADPHVIAVTATDADDKLFPASNRGRHIAVAAPGVDIFLPKPGGSYDFTSGTSFAAAHVSGVAALILERKPDLSPEDVRKILLATAKDLGPKGRDDQFGAGLIDALQAITVLEPGKFQASGSAPR
jgi:subtilisin family serine protease